MGIQSRNWSMVIGGLLVLCPAALAVTNGQPDQDGHPYIGRLELFKSGRQIGQCSGALVAPTTFLTAAKCFVVFGEVDETRVLFDSVVLGNSPRMKGLAWFAHPDFCIACRSSVPGLDTRDIAVLLLEYPIEDRGFALLPNANLLNTLPKRTQLTVVGYGTPETPPAFPTRYYALTSHVPSQNFSSADWLRLSNPAPKKDGSTFDDAGAPVLLGNIVLGITTFPKVDTSKGNFYATRIDLGVVTDFILQYVLVP